MHIVLAAPRGLRLLLIPRRGRDRNVDDVDAVLVAVAAFVVLQPLCFPLLMIVVVLSKVAFVPAHKRQVLLDLLHFLELGLLGVVSLYHRGILDSQLDELVQAWLRVAIVSQIVLEIVLEVLQAVELCVDQGAHAVDFVVDI